MDIDYTIIALRTLERQVLYVCKCGQVHLVYFVNSLHLIADNIEKLLIRGLKNYVIVHCEKHPVLLMITGWELNGRLFMPYINWLQKNGYEYPMENYDVRYIDVYKYISIPCRYKFNIDEAFKVDLDDSIKIKISKLIRKIMDISDDNIKKFYHYCIESIQISARNAGVDLIKTEDNCGDLSEDIVKTTEFGVFIHEIFGVWFNLGFHRLDRFGKPEMDIHIGNYKVYLRGPYIWVWHVEENQKLTVILEIMNTIMYQHTLTQQHTHKNFITHIIFNNLDENEFKIEK